MTLSGGSSKKTSDPLIEDMTEAINKQVGLLKKNFKEEVEFSFDFRRAWYEVERVDQLEPREKRFAQTQAIVNIQYEKYSVDKAGTSYYHAKVKLNPEKALTLLSRYDVSLDFRAARTYREKDFPKTSDDPELPPAGIVSFFGDLPDPDKNERIKGKRVPVLFSYQFDIRSEYWPDERANKDDFLRVRMGIWHEIMECTILSIAAEALYMPKFLYYDYMGPGAISTSLASFAQIAVWNAQKRAILPRKEKIFLYWKGDPPFEAFESQSRSHEEEAERLASNASSLDKGGSHLQANSKWKECAEAWERAARAWDASTHPDARSKAKDAREEMRVAAKKAGHWEVNPSSGKEITIKYRDWFGDFEAEILDTTGRRIDKFTRSIEQGEICWGAEGRIKAGTYFVKVKLLGDEFEKEKIAILG